MSSLALLQSLKESILIQANVKAIYGWLYLRGLLIGIEFLHLERRETRIGELSPTPLREAARRYRRLPEWFPELIGAVSPLAKD